MRKTDQLNPYVEAVIRTHPPLSADEERRIFTTLPRQIAEDTVILHSLAYAAESARHWHIPNATIDDVFQYVVLAMVKAVKAYDISKCDPKMRFTGYAKTAITNAMLNLCSERSHLTDTIMNLRANPLSKTMCEAGDQDLGSLMDVLIERGRGIAGLTDLPRLEFDDKMLLPFLIAAFKKWREAKGFPTPKKHICFSKDLNRFCLSAIGLSYRKIANEEGIDFTVVRDSVFRVRAAFSEWLRSAECPMEWQWLKKNALWNGSS